MEPMDSSRQGNALLGTSIASFVAGALLTHWLASRRRRRDGGGGGGGGGDGGRSGERGDGFEEEFEEEERALQSNGGAREWSLDDGPFKLVLIVNMQLKMGKGKVVAQCCHATLGNYRISERHCPSALKGWEQMGQAKICVKCPTETELYYIQAKAQAAGLVNYLVVSLATVLSFGLYRIVTSALQVSGGLSTCRWGCGPSRHIGFSRPDASACPGNFRPTSRLPFSRNPDRG
ncbi:unnamed protein product [Pylaiella littoralis]